MIDLVPPKGWTVSKHKSKELWEVTGPRSEYSPLTLTHCRAVAEAWRCRSMELEDELVKVQEKEAVFRAEVNRHRAADERDDQAQVEIKRLERKCDALGRVNDDLEEKGNELRRRLSQRAVNI